MLDESGEGHTTTTSSTPVFRAGGRGYGVTRKNTFAVAGTPAMTETRNAAQTTRALFIAARPCQLSIFQPSQCGSAVFLQPDEKQCCRPRWFPGRQNRSRWRTHYERSSPRPRLLPGRVKVE